MVVLKSSSFSVGTYSQKNSKTEHNALVAPLKANELPVHAALSCSCVSVLVSLLSRDGDVVNTLQIEVFVQKLDFVSLIDDAADDQDHFVATSHDPQKVVCYLCTERRGCARGGSTWVARWRGFTGGSQLVAVRGVDGQTQLLMATK